MNSLGPTRPSELSLSSEWHCQLVEGRDTSGAKDQTLRPKTAPGYFCGITVTNLEILHKYWPSWKITRIQPGVYIPAIGSGVAAVPSEGAWAPQVTGPSCIALAHFPRWQNAGPRRDRSLPCFLSPDVLKLKAFHVAIGESPFSSFSHPVLSDVPQCIPRAPGHDQSTLLFSGTGASIFSWSFWSLSSWGRLSRSLFPLLSFCSLVSQFQSCSLSRRAPWKCPGSAVFHTWKV